VAAAVRQWLQHKIRPIVTAWGAGMVFVSTGWTEEALHTRIDQLLDAANVSGQAPLASDADYLRRTYLTLHGVIPTAAQARAFLSDAAPDKRAKLVDALVTDGQFARWMAIRFDVMLMERRGEKHVKSAPWREYLEASFAANKPWNVLVQEIIANDGADEKTRAAARWILDREADPNAITKDVSRIFLGRDISCAQCHDHVRIDDYTQREYHGLLAFTSRSYLFQPDMNKPAFVAERAAGETSYNSVFTKLGGGAQPRLVGSAEIVDPVIAAAEQWTVAPNEKDKNVRPVPKHSRRAALAQALSEGSNVAFRRNIANRLWSIVFGRGLVEPLDLHHASNPPAHPALMDMLAESIGTMKFDMRGFVRELALTHAFQRSLDLPELPPEKAKVIAEKLPTIEQEAEALKTVVSAIDKEFETVEDAMEDTQRAAQPVSAEWQKQNTATAAAEKAMTEAQAGLKKSEDVLAARREAQKLLAEAAAKVNEAIAKVPEAADLAPAAKTFQTKADETAGAMTAMEQEAAKKKAEAEARQQTLAAAQQNLTAAKAKVDEAEKIVAAKQAELDAAAAKQQAERTKAKHAALRVGEVKAALAWAVAAAADKPVREAAQQIEAAFASAQQNVEKLNNELAVAPERLVLLEGEATMALAAWTKAKEGVTLKQPAAATLAEASAKATAAAAKVVEDAAIAAAAAAVKAKADALRTELTNLEKAAADAQARADSATRQRKEFQANLEKAKIDLTSAQQRLPALEAEAKSARTKAKETAGPAQEAREALAAAWGRSFAASELSPLQPEQLCWSVMQATGMIEQHRVQAASEWDAKNKLSDADKANPAKQAERTAAVEKLFREKLQAHENQYVRSFGGAPGQPQTDFFATPEQALYFENAGVLRSWASALANRVAALPDPKVIAEELYLSVLTRFPAQEEISELMGTLSARPADKKAEALVDYTWALVTSVEFRFSH
jgi:hypothetical protein